MATFDITNSIKELQNVLIKMQGTQKQIEDFQQNVNPQQSEIQKNSYTTYPKAEPNTAEDIISNPQWNDELKRDFANSDYGKKAGNYMDVCFLEFVERQTGKQSTTLLNLRQQNESQSGNEKTTYPKVEVEPVKEKSNGK